MRNLAVYNLPAIQPKRQENKISLSKNHVEAWGEPAKIVATGIAVFFIFKGFAAIIEASNNRR